MHEGIYTYIHEDIYINKDIHSNMNAYIYEHLTVSSDNGTPPKSTKSRNSNSWVQFQIKPKSQIEFVPRDTEKTEFLDLVYIGVVAISMETVILTYTYMKMYTYIKACIYLLA